MDATDTLWIVLRIGAIVLSSGACAFGLWRLKRPRGLDGLSDEGRRNGAMLFGIVGVLLLAYLVVELALNSADLGLNSIRGRWLLEDFAEHGATWASIIAGLGVLWCVYAVHVLRK